MSDGDPGGQALIHAARASGPSADDRARVRAALVARLGAAAFAPAPPPAAPAPAPPVAAPAQAAAAGAIARLLVGGVLVAALGFGAGVLAGRPSGPAVAPARHGVEAETLRRAWLMEREAARSSAAIASAPISPAIDAPPSPVIAAPRLIARSSPPGKLAHATPRPSVEPAFDLAPALSPAPAAKTSSLLEETEALRRAQTALQSGDAKGALTALQDLGARHPDGLLREERLAAYVLALCAAGRPGDARHEADLFLAEAPRSIQAKRVRASCAFTNESDTHR